VIKRKNILIISYTFPPSPGIGGRRWAKFGKYLERSGFEVYVLSAYQKKSSKSPWDQDVKKLHISTFKSNYPELLFRPHNSFFEKVLRYFYVRLLPLIIKGTIYERASLDMTEVMSEASSIIETKKINNLIVTGAPFRLFYFGVELKRKYQHLNFIADIRDPWLDSENYGFKGLAPNRFQYEKSIFDMMVKYADYITIPSEVMRRGILKFNDGADKKVKVLPHGFDTDDFLTIEPSPQKNNNLIRFIYGGTIYEGIEAGFNAVMEVVKDFNNVRLDFFAPGPLYQDIVIKKKLTGKVFFKEMIPSEKLMKEIKNSDFYLLIYPEKYKDFLSTKFFEILFLKIPIVFIGYPGEVWNFIQNNNIGFTFLPSEAEENFRKLLNGEFKFYASEYKQIHNYDLKHIVANQIVPLLK
jgi:glycosyltransferase involved in cell wall biosynthesis